MTHKPYPDSASPDHRQPRPESATTDRLIALVRQSPRGRGLPHRLKLCSATCRGPARPCDHLLSGEATALDVAYRLASLIDAIEGRSDRPAPLRRTH